MPSTVIEGDFSAKGLRFAIIVGRFNSFVTERLLAGALDALGRSGCPQESIEIVRVPGSWEMPVVARELARAKCHDAIIALGAVIRGETPHFDYVAAEVSRGLAQVATDTGVPVGFGVLTTNTVEQAVDRAGVKGGNKGFDVAMTAIEMANLMRRLRQPSA
jgi:6,7-dimethyl-8-ribityllumazine synthase